jgi:hypothetical protein
MGQSHVFRSTRRNSGYDDQMTIAPIESGLLWFHPVAMRRRGDTELARTSPSDGHLSQDFFQRFFESFPHIGGFHHPVLVGVILCPAFDTDKMNAGDTI